MMSLKCLLESQVVQEYLKWLEILEWVERSVDNSILLTLTVHD